MKHIFLTLLTIVLLPFIVLPQTISLKETVELTNNASDGFYFPKFSPDGSKIFFTKENYKGIYFYDAGNKSIKMLNDEDGAGYEFNVNSQDNLVYYRSDRYINGKKYSTLKSLEITTGTIKNIVSDKRGLSTPRYIGTNKIAFTVQNNLMLISGNKIIKKTGITSIDKPFALIENCKIALYVGGKKKILAPVGNGNYIWPSVSPDNTKLLFTLAGKGTFVTDLNGNIISKLGYANYPQWSPDGKWISYMVDKDDGNAVTSSDVYIASWDGEKIFQITDSKNNRVMYPEWSPAGNQIVVNTYDGKIQLLTLNFKM